MIEKGDYIVFIDESGDHNVEKIDPKYPIFVITFCCFNIDEFTNQVTPALQGLKIKYFGHDQVVLHEADIRKRKKPFQFSGNEGLRNSFLSELSEIIGNIPFIIVSVVIDKTKLKSQYNKPFNPYHLGLRFGLEKLNEVFLNKKQKGKEISLVFEKRGKKEDIDLEKEFFKICSENEQFGYKQVDYAKVIYKLVFADKKSNSTGLQIADLIARPIGLNYLDPLKSNRAYEVISSKIYANKKFPLKTKSLFAIEKNTQSNLLASA
ncbi:MAG: DUF3800 domain-containing protein [Polaribacter sp.]|uniref:DUF3800 domain-containing protein n=1 Tax=Polaribacter sp. TaxID=1920175 RepID=UPI003EF36E4B